MPERYTDGYGHDELPLFRKGRDKQIEDMAEFVGDFHGKHYDCPTCGVKTTEWKKRIISTAVASLGRLVYLYDSIPIHHDEFTVLKKDRNFSQLVFWGLVSPGVNPEQLKRSAGTWEPTSKGVAFVNGGLLIQSHLVTYDNKLVGFSGELIDVVWALNNKFDFRVLLSENFKGKNT